MVDIKTVFILGAGASAELKFPVGNILTTEIRHLTNLSSEPLSQPRPGEQTHFRKAIDQHVHDSGIDWSERSGYYEAARLIAKNMATADSIDAFVESHAENEKIVLCAKLAITQSILKYEKSCPLSRITRHGQNCFEPEDAKDSWHPKFLNLLTSGPRESIGDRLRKVAFVIFNYDRCLEHFLFNALQDWYDIDWEKAAEILDSVQFLHPYGSLGPLPWQDRNQGIRFGADLIYPEEHLRISEGIKTYSEQKQNRMTIENIHQIMMQAEAAVFLGFSFLEQNIELLNPPHVGKLEDIYATSHDISEDDLIVIKSRLEGRIVKDPQHGDRVHFTNKKCLEFFQTRSRTLASLVR